MRGSVTADHIIIAVDKLSKSISPLADEVFHAQTFLSVTEPLTDRELRILFPVRRADAVLGFQARVLLFPADRRQSPAARRWHADHDLPQGCVQQSAHHRRIIKDFSDISRSCATSFMQFWPGQIDTTRDLLPVIAGRPGMPHMRFIFGCGGNSVGDVLRQFHGAERARRCGRRLQEVLQLLLEPARISPCRAAWAK